MSRALFEQSGQWDDGSSEDGRTNGLRALIDNSGFVFFVSLAVDWMLFAGLVAAYFVLRSGAQSWPPADLPYLDTPLAFRSTISLLLAAIFLTLTVISQNRNALKTMQSSLVMAFVFLAAFLTFNGIEWKSLLTNAVSARTAFGGIYFILTGVFHLHIAACAIYILIKLRRTLRWRQYTRSAVSFPRLSYFVYAMLTVWVGIFCVIYL
jgi:cytochrome o ubiquinol oxidase subunit 3